jgi:solute carrier family 12 sodium/potassium/chloride transporter 2
LNFQNNQKLFLVDVLSKKKNIGFGTAPVFFTTISTILGAILFLRFGWAAGHVGFWGVISIILLGHLVTIPTAMAIAEIATNQKVEGGGAYYIISRSFGINIGGAIGIALFLAQAISISFYVVAFAESFTPVLDYVNNQFGWHLKDIRIISVPSMIALGVLIFVRGANMGVKALYFIAGILFLSIFLFFIGKPIHADYVPDFTSKISNGIGFYAVFAVIFPAFTGIIAGLGLSGDLRDPKKSIPLGTISATLVGGIVYIIAAYKLVSCASPQQLVSDQLIMSKIAVWGPIIPIGLAAGAISSALGSIMVAPRTLQALGADDILGVKSINNWMAKGKAKDNEPQNAGLISIVLAFFFVVIGNINFIAEVISMFFIIIYGVICLISFFEHFAADPAYRPSFKSKWWLSLIGAVLSFIIMFRMNLQYAVISLLALVIIFMIVSNTHKDRAGLSNIFKGVIFQLSRNLRVFLQKSSRNEDKSNWRPSIICISADSFKRMDDFELLRWLSHKYGFGTYIHYMQGYLSKSTFEESGIIQEKLLKIADVSKSNIFIDTLISPSYTSAIAQVIQLPSVSGKENNMILFEYSKKEPQNLEHVIENFQLLKSVNFDVCILGSSEKSYGYKSELHIWITTRDIRNANLMILLGYIILGHPDWHKGMIKIFAIYPEDEMQQQRKNLLHSIKSGRLPISPNNINLIAMKEDEKLQPLICSNSQDANLTIIGFREEQIKHNGTSLFGGYDVLGNVLFVNTSRDMQIS